MSYAESQYIIDELTKEIPKIKGSGIPPKNIDFTVTSRESRFSIRWTPVNTYIEDKCVCASGGTYFVIKKGSTPETIDDGVSIHMTEKEYWSHQTTPLIVEGDFENKATYYIRAFTYSDQNVFNLEENVKTCAFSTLPKLQIWGFHQDFTNLDPDTSITYGIEGTENKDYATPVHGNVSTGASTLGDWSTWEWLQNVKPYWLDENGDVAYALDPENYLLKVDGTSSDIIKDDVDGGAYVWIPRLYTKEVYSSDGNSRDVYFSNTNQDPDSSDFKNEIFIDKDGNEIEGFWFPMSFPMNNAVNYYIRSDDVTKIYASTCNKNSKAYARLGSPSDIKTVNDQFDSYEKQFILEKLSISNPDRIGFASVGLSIFIRDILWMLAKSPYDRKNYGVGFVDSYSSIPSFGFPFTGGMFYGTGLPTLKSSSFTKCLHSFVIGSYGLSLIDPYSYRQYVWTNTQYRYGRADIYINKSPFKKNTEIAKSFGGGVYSQPTSILSELSGFTATVDPDTGLCYKPSSVTLSNSTGTTSFSNWMFPIKNSNSSMTDRWVYNGILPFSIFGFGYCRYAFRNTDSLEFPTTSNGTAVGLGSFNLVDSLGGTSNCQSYDTYTLLVSVLPCIAPPSPTYTPY